MRFFRLIFLSILFVCVLCAATPSVFADAASDLQAKIDQRNQQIKDLEAQLATYNTAALQASQEATSLKAAIASLQATQKKLSTDLALTQAKIQKASLTIDQLNDKIADTSDHIETNKQAIAASIQNADRMEKAGLLQMVLSSKNLNDVWNDLESIHQIEGEIKNQSDQLHTLQADLESQHEMLTGQKKQLVSLQQDLSGKKQAVEQTAAEQNNLLSQTKNKQAAYAQLIKTTAAQKAQFEQDVFNYESQLKLSIDPNGYPAPQHGILSWPLDSVFITQLFGKTVGAEKLYVSGSHNGVDFRATVGTRVKNVLDGTVVGTGNTDIYPGCYSFGKWVMVKHDNGLSTIYGHLSVISVTQGQRLATGDLIGYSGNTGYTTGPHLHISVYATQGVRIEQFVNSRGCKQAVIPLADVKAYLDPMAYFPAYNQ